MGNLNDKLLEASYTGNYSKASGLLKKGAEVNHGKSDSGETALMLACQNGHHRVASLLLDQHADLNQTNSYGGTALYLASFNGHVDIANLLIQKGAAINHQIKDGSTPLMAAAYNGHTLVVIKLLLDHSANVNLQRNDGGSALLSAIFNGHQDLAILLLKNGADANLSKRDGHSPLILACSNGLDEVVDALLQHGASVDTQTDKGQTALIEASTTGDCSMVKSLLQHKADVHAENKENKNALLLAILNRHPQTTIMLLEAGAKLPSVSYNNRHGNSISRSPELLQAQDKSTRDRKVHNDEDIVLEEESQIKGEQPPVQKDQNLKKESESIEKDELEALELKNESLQENIIRTHDEQEKTISSNAMDNTEYAELSSQDKSRDDQNSTHSEDFIDGPESQHNQNHAQNTCSSELKLDPPSFQVNNVEV